MAGFNQDKRHVFRGSCTVCHCSGYRAGEEGSYRCNKCGHPPGKHHKLEGPPSNNLSTSHGDTTVNQASSAPLHDCVSCARQESLDKEEPMETNDANTPHSLQLCKHCNKNEVFFDRMLNVPFVFCSPQCRDDSLLIADGQRLKTDIAELERMPIVDDREFLKHALTNSQEVHGRANSTSRNVERGDQILSKISMKASGSKLEKNEETIEIFNSIQYGLGLELLLIPAHSDKSYMEITGLNLMSITRFKVLQDKFHIFDMVTKVNGHSLIKLSEVLRGTIESRVKVTIIKRNILPSVCKPLLDYGHGRATHLFGLRFSSKGSISGLSLSIIDNEIKIVGIENGSLSKEVGLRYGDTICGYSLIKEKDKFVTETCPHSVSEIFLKTLCKYLEDAPIRQAIIFLFIYRRVETRWTC